MGPYVPWGCLYVWALLMGCCSMASALKELKRVRALLAKSSLQNRVLGLEISNFSSAPPNHGGRRRRRSLRSRGGLTETLETVETVCFQPCHRNSEKQCLETVSTGTYGTCTYRYLLHVKVGSYKSRLARAPRRGVLAYDRTTANTHFLGF